MEELVDREARIVFDCGNTIPRDPWSNEYQYRVFDDKSGFVVYSYGADGKIGGAGDDADISSIVELAR